MILSTICYIEKDNKYLMLHRTKKENDINKNKWIGVGGKIEEGESPEECIEREVKEETGLILKKYRLRGIITYTSTTCEADYMYLFSANDFEGELIECNEGDLKWVEKDNIMNLNLWEGDKIFLEKLLKEDNSLFTIKFEYDGDKLLKYTINEY